MLDIGIDTPRSRARAQGCCAPAGGRRFVDGSLALDVELRAARTASRTAQGGEERAHGARSRRRPIAPPKRSACARRSPNSTRRSRARARGPGARGARSTRSCPTFRTCSTTPSPTAPGEADNVVVRSSGTAAAARFPAQSRIGRSAKRSASSISNARRSSRAAASRSCAGKGARLSRALAAFFLDRAAQRGYVEIAPPLLVTRETMWSTGQLTKFADAMFRDTEADLFMIPTSEVPLTALHRDEILDGEALPLRYTGVLAVFSQGGGRGGQGHARADSPASVRKSRTRVAHGAGAFVRGAREADGGRRGSARRTRASASRDGAVRAATSVSTPRKRTISKSGFRPKRRIARSARARTAPISRRAARRSASGATRKRSPNSCTRSTARGSPSAARSSRSWKTTSKPTAA